MQSQGESYPYIDKAIASSIKPVNNSKEPQCDHIHMNFFTSCREFYRYTEIIVDK